MMIMVRMRMMTMVGMMIGVIMVGMMIKVVTQGIEESEALN